MTPVKAVFLDRDGTLIHDGPFLSDPEGIRFLPGVLEGLRALKEDGFALVLVTNQSGIGRGLFTEETLAEIHGRLREILEKNGSPLDAIYFCPHAPGDECECRKPKSTLFKRAIQEHGIDPALSFAIGDRIRDTEPAGEVGCRTVLIGEAPEGERVDYAAPDFQDAARWIVRESRLQLQKDF